MCISTNIQQARKNAKLTQAQLADKIGKGVSTVQKYELGLANPPIEVMRKISEVLEVPLTDLIVQETTDNEYELICDTLATAGFDIAPAGLCPTGDAERDIYYISRAEDPDDPDMRREIEYSKLAELIHSVLADADKKRTEYLQKRLEAELF